MWVGVDHCSLARSPRRRPVDSFAWSGDWLESSRKAYVLTKQNDEDLQYYLWKDPAHDAFKVSMIPTHASLLSNRLQELNRCQNNIKIDGVVVLDFTDIYPNSS
jgi:hypothetical protein